MVAPTYKMLTQVTLREFRKFCPHQLIREYNKSEQKITLINGVEILGVAGDREDTIDRIRGLNIGGGYGDEIALCPEYMHEILIERLRDPNGCMKIWYTTTPKGYNWLHRIFVEKKDKSGNPLRNPEDYEVFFGTTMDNPYTPEEYKATLLNTFIGVFAKQEIYGEFVGFEGLVYPEFRRDIHVIDTAGMKFEGIVAGVDFGFTNPSVVLKVGLDSDGRMYVLDEFYERHVTDSELAQWAKDNMGEAEIFVADSANPAGIQEFKDRDLNCRGVEKRAGERSENFVLSGIKAISGLLAIQKDGKPRLFIDKRCVNTIMEFENYRYPDKRENAPDKEAPLKIYDHSLDALRYLVMTLNSAMEGIIYLE